MVLAGGVVAVLALCILPVWLLLLFALALGYWGRGSYFLRSCSTTKSVVAGRGSDELLEEQLPLLMPVLLLMLSMLFVFSR